MSKATHFLCAFEASFLNPCCCSCQVSVLTRSIDGSPRTLTAAWKSARIDGMPCLSRISSGSRPSNLHDGSPRGEDRGAGPDPDERDTGGLFIGVLTTAAAGPPWEGAGVPALRCWVFPVGNTTFFFLFAFGSCIGSAARTKWSESSEASASEAGPAPLLSLSQASLPARTSSASLNWASSSKSMFWSDSRNSEFCVEAMESNFRCCWFAEMMAEPSSMVSWCISLSLSLYIYIYIIYKNSNINSIIIYNIIYIYNIGYIIYTYTYNHITISSCSYILSYILCKSSYILYNHIIYTISWFVIHWICHLPICLWIWICV